MIIRAFVDMCEAGAISWLAVSFFLTFFGRANRALFAIARWVYIELRPLYLPFVVVVITYRVMTGQILHGLTWLGDFFALLNWFTFKDIDVDDDRWKRRKARVLEKIKRLGSRLVAVPASGES